MVGDFRTRPQICSPTTVFANNSTALESLKTGYMPVHLPKIPKGARAIKCHVQKLPTVWNLLTVIRVITMNSQMLVLP